MTLELHTQQSKTKKQKKKHQNTKNTKKCNDNKGKKEERDTGRVTLHDLTKFEKCAKIAY